MSEEKAIPRQRVAAGISINADLSAGPYFVDGCDTLVKLWAQRCRELEGRTAHREKEYGIWQSHSWADFRERAMWIGMGLRKLGLKRGECVSILAEDSKEWIYADLGVQAVGGIPSGVYSTDSARQLAYLVNDSDSRFLFVGDDEQLDKWLAVRDAMPGLARVIVFRSDGLGDFADDRVMFLEDLYDAGRAEAELNPGVFEDEIERSRPEDVALLVYTSGTTGNPKGAMLTHSNIMYSISTAPDTLLMSPDDEHVCFLPLCHVLERTVSVLHPIAIGSTVNFAESPETVFDNIREVSPTVFVAVPRVWEKMHSRIANMEADATWLGRWAYGRALSAGMARADAALSGRPPPFGVVVRHLFWEFVLLKNLRRMLGMDRLRRGNTGAVSISPDLLKWFQAIGVRIFEGYGMTESAGIMTLNTAAARRLGTVGRNVPGSEIRIGKDGEIQFRAASCFKGYWRDNESSADALTADGWLRTGDTGEMDADGYLTVTGRIKDIIITSGGKNVAPAKIEDRLKASPYVSDAIVIGDGRKYLTCLIMIDQETVEKFAQDNRLPFSDFASLTQVREVRNLIGGVVDAVNGDFARVEQIKDFRLIDVLLTAEDEELTATMKLRRSFVEKNHGALVDEMYA